MGNEDEDLIITFSWLFTMDINEIKEIMDLAAKLQGTFKHIRYLCGKYEELQKGGNTLQPYNNFPFMPNDYGPPQNYPQDPYYQTPYNHNFAYNQQINPYFPPTNTFPVNEILKTASNLIGNNITAQQIQQGKNQKIPNLQKKTESNQTSNYLPKQQTNNGPNQTRKPTTSSQSGGYPESPYYVFLMKKKGQIKNEYPHLGEKQLVEIMLEVWKSFTDDQKKPYELEFKRLKYNFLSKGNEEKSTQKQINPDMIKNLKNQLMK